MVNIFCPINEATIKSNYPMKRIEPIVNALSQEKYRLGPKFQADASNGYYVVPLWREHAYKTAFSCSLGQFCYNVIGQGLSGAPHTYSRLKDLAMGCIPTRVILPKADMGPVDLEADKDEVLQYLHSFVGI